VTEEQAIGLTVLVVIVVIAILFASARASRKSESEEALLPPVEIARIVDPGIIRNSAAGGSALILVIVSAVSIFKYFGAQTVNEQIVALLLWIGNGVFWGAFMLGAIISSGKTSVVYREPALTERREPKL
jgi:hypothetical protein